jgi:hypothetical protein
MSSSVDVKQKGWRPDPSGKYEWRYWDGGWTNRVANSTTPAEPPLSAPAAAVATGPSPSPAHAPGTFGAELPRSASELAVLKAVEAGRPSTKRPPSEPAAPPPGYSEPGVPQPRTGPWAAVVGWCRAFTDQPESYHSPKAGVALPPHPQQISMLAATPANYGRAGLVALAAFGLGVGAYLPWLSGTIDGLPFQRTGLDLGRSWGFTWLAASLALAAMLGVRLRPMRWVNMTLAVVVACLVARELIDVNQQITNMNAVVVVKADVGIGLWIMLVSAAGALIASFRIGAPE